MLIRLRVLDYAAIILSLAVVGAAAAYAYQDRGGGTSALIQGRDGEWIYPLDRDREVTIDGPVGPTVVSIHSGQIRVVSATCRDRVCVSMGAISRPGAWIACLPNRLFIRIRGTDADVDATAF